MSKRYVKEVKTQMVDHRQCDSNRQDIIVSLNGRLASFGSDFSSREVAYELLCEPATCSEFCFHIYVNLNYL